jgi:Carbohydrate-selective porin, OprB family
VALNLGYLPAIFQITKQDMHIKSYILPARLLRFSESIGRLSIIMVLAVTSLCLSAPSGKAQSQSSETSNGQLDISSNQSKNPLSQSISVESGNKEAGTTANSQKASQTEAKDKIATTIPDSKSKPKSSLLASDQKTPEVAPANSKAADKPSVQPSDIKSDDWKFKALQSLAQRYGCKPVAENSTITRNEFAQGLNSCVDRVGKLLVAGATPELVKQEDLATLQKLQEEFKTELAALQGRVDAIDARTSKIERQQFSTNTKLSGEVIFSVAGVNGGNQAISRNFIPSFDPTNNPDTPYQTPPPGNTPIPGINTRTANALYGIDDGENFGKPRDSGIGFSSRVRLNLTSSFTGRDALKLRLEAQNTTEGKSATGTNYGRLSFDGNNNNQVNLTVAQYDFPIGDKILVRVAPQNELYRMIESDVEAVSPLEDDGNGSISKFGRFNPLFRLGGENIRGASLTYAFSPAVSLTGVYAGTGDANSGKTGLFNGGYIALAQLTLKPAKDLTIGLTYANSFSPNLSGDDSSAFDRETGSKLATNPFPNVGGSAAVVNSYGVEAAYKFSPGFTLSGWAGHSAATQLASSGNQAGITNWALSASFPDLGGDGNLLGFVFGQPPKVTSNTYGPGGAVPEVVGGPEKDTSYHLEAFYRYQIAENLSVTPGIILITNPENNSSNSPLWVGAVRTTFTF